MVKVLDYNDNHLTILNDDGKVECVVNDDYYHLKYDMVNINHRDETDRIYHDFTDTQKIQETYNNKIFNLMFSGVILQSRQEEANRICQFITNEDCTGYMKYCGDRYQVLNCQDLMKKLLFAYAGRLKFRKRGIVVDDNFMVGYDGSAFVKKFKRWQPLCLVVDGYIREKLIDTAVGSIRMSRLLQTIMVKVGFCLKPNVKDRVFMNQLGKDLQRVLTDEARLKEREEKKKLREQVKQTRLDNELRWGT